MTEVWLTAVTFTHADDSADVTVPVTSEGSSRVTAVHDLVGVRSADVPYEKDDRAFRNRIRVLNAAVADPTLEQQIALRCEAIPALVVVGFEPHAQSDADFATGVKSLVALRHVDPPKGWDDGALMESLGDAVLDELVVRAIITENEAAWLSGDLMPEEAQEHGFSPDPAVRAARIVRVITDPDPDVMHAVRFAITGQSTRRKITSKLKFEVASSLIMRAVNTGEEKVEDIRRYLKEGFGQSIAKENWEATYRPTSEVVAAALEEVKDGHAGSSTLELAARSAYPLIASRQLFGDRGTKDSSQPDRRVPGEVLDRMRRDEVGIRQLGRALDDYAAGKRIRAVSADGSIVQIDDGQGQLVTDLWLRNTFAPDGRRRAPKSPKTVAEHFDVAIAGVGDAFEALSRAITALEEIEGLDGRPMVSTDGVAPNDIEAWSKELFEIMRKLPVWGATHLARFGPGGGTRPQVHEKVSDDEGQWPEGHDEGSEDLDDEVGE
jgi:hypothetical protein